MIMNYKFFDRIMAIFVAVLLVSNIASSAKIVDWGVGIFGMPLAFDAGALLIPISYIFGDVLTEVYGYQHNRRVIWMGFFCSLLMSLVFWIVGIMPGESYWQENVGQAQYDAILGGVSSGAIVIASLVAYWVGEFSNSYVLAKMKILTAGRWLWMRTIGSTLIGQGIDTILFVTLAMALKAPGFIPEIWATLVVTNYVFKVGVEGLMTPLTYRVVNYLKQIENEDYYDIDTDFNPFRFHSRTK